MTDTKKGGRPRKGTVITLPDGRHQPVITLQDGSRKRMKPLPLGTSKAMALEKAAYWTEQAQKMGAKRPAPPATASPGTEWWESYLAHRDAKGHAPVRWILNQHITPVLGDKHPKDWTRQDCEAIVTALDLKIAAGALSWKSGANAWSLFTKACKVASSAKSATGLRVRDDNPCTGVERPERGADKEKQWLRPAEVSALLASDKVPLRWRQMYAILAYAYLRPSELKALDWSDVDLLAGTLHVTKAWDHERARIKAPKSEAGVRYVPIEPTLLPLLKALHEAAGGKGAVFVMPPIEAWAVTFRKHLERAGIDRAELFQDTATQKRIRMYDLRASGLTWRALRQDYAPAIHEAAGHEDFDTTLEYVRTAQLFVGRVGEPFPPLPDSLFGVEFRSEYRSESTQVSEIIASPTGFEPVLQP
jgi:integrase